MVAEGLGAALWQQCSQMAAIGNLWALGTTMGNKHTCSHISATATRTLADNGECWVAAK